MVDNQILADLHVHLTKASTQQEEFLEKLVSGITGVTDNVMVKEYLNVHQIADAARAQEAEVITLEQGRLYSVTHQGETGYLLKAQEITSTPFHFNALGLSGTLNAGTHSRSTISQIQGLGGFAVINHLDVVEDDGSFLGIPTRFRRITQKERAEVRRLVEYVNAVETFNAQNIDVAPKFLHGILPDPFHMASANDEAAYIAVAADKPRIAASDTHGDINQVGTAGIWLTKGINSWADIRDQIASKDYRLKEEHVDLESFAKAHDVRIFGVPIGNLPLNKIPFRN